MSERYSLTHKGAYQDHGDPHKGLTGGSQRRGWGGGVFTWPRRHAITLTLRTIGQEVSALEELLIPSCHPICLPHLKFLNLRASLCPY